MITTNLYELAYTENVFVRFCSLPQNKSISVRFNCSYYIGIDSALVTSSAEEKVKLAHELGHCMTDSFYNINAPLDVRGKHEHKADEWAIKRLIPKDELKNAISNGYTEIWQLSEWFNVTHEFINKAVRYYKFEKRGSSMDFYDFLISAGMTLFIYMIVPGIVCISQPKLTIKKANMVALINAIAGFLIMCLIHFFAGGTPSIVACAVWYVVTRWLIRACCVAKTSYANAVNASDCENDKPSDVTVQDVVEVETNEQPNTKAETNEQPNTKAETISKQVKYIIMDIDSKVGVELFTELVAMPVWKKASDLDGIEKAFETSELSIEQFAFQSLIFEINNILVSDDYFLAKQFVPIKQMLERNYRQSIAKN